MKFSTILTVLILLISLKGVSAQDREKRNVSSFDGIKVSTAIDVYLKQGSNESVEVEVSGIDLDEVITEVSGNRLKIYLDRGNHRNHKVKVYVTIQDLTEVTASSASSVFGEGRIQGKYLELKASSAADIELNVNYEDIAASASSSGDIELEGVTKNLDISVSSAGGVDAYDLEANNVEVRASSAGGARVTANSSIDARASSGGSIRYRGNPTKSQTDSSSGGSVRKSN